MQHFCKYINLSFIFISKEYIIMRPAFIIIVAIIVMVMFLFILILSGVDIKNFLSSSLSIVIGGLKLSIGGN